MTYTENYNLALPAGTDPASITPLNRNATMIDGYLKDLQDQIDEGGGGIDIDVIGEGSGSLVTFNDGSGLPLKSMTVDIEAVQSGSGTPSLDNVRPISGWSSIDVETAGKNICGEMIDNYVLNFSTGLPSPNSNYKITDYIFVKQGQVYTISNCTSGSENWFYDISKTPKYNIPRIPSNNIRTFSPEENGYIRCSIGNSSANIFQIELGSDPTSHELYQGTITTIDLNRTVYKGTLNIIDGILTIAHGMIDMEDISWTYDSAGFWVTSNRPSELDIDYSENLIMADRYLIYDDANVPYISSHPGTMVLNSNYNIWVNNGDAVTIPVGQFVFKLATPQTYQLTPQQIATLIGTNNISADGLNIDLEYIKGGDFTDAVKAIIDVTIGSSNAILSEVIGE